MTDNTMLGGPTGLGQDDFFVCDVFDAIPKNDMASMEHPLFSLATRPDRRVLSYEHNGNTIQVVPSVKGLATIHDKDILIYCISQLMAALNMGRSVSRTLHLKAADLLSATNRDASGDGYKRLKEAFERLAGTRITTNVATGETETTSGFGLIESWRIVRKTKTGRMVNVVVTLSEWLFRAVMSKSVLTISRGYFNLRKPLERRIYELSRKHCGRQAEWRVSVETLLKKSGSASPRRVFRKMIRDIIAADTLPDYRLTEQPGDIICVTRKDAVLETMNAPILSSGIYEEARSLMPGHDIYALEAEWRRVWMLSGQPRFRSPDKAFIGWLKKKANA